MSATPAPETARTLAVTWEDPLRGAAAATERSGLEYLRAVLAGEIARPPLGVVLGIQMRSIDPGRTVFSLDCGEHLYNPFGGVHGGVLATVLDSAMGCAVHSTLPAGVASTTVDLNATYLRPATRDTGRLTCEAEVIHAGRKIATARGQVHDDDGRIYATGTTTCLILRPPQDPADSSAAGVERS